MNVDKLYEIDPDKGIYAGNGNCIEKNIHYLGARRAKVFWHPSWLITPKSLPRIIRWHQALRDAGAQLIICCNEVSEIKWCKIASLKCTLLNQNLHECEHEYQIINQQKLYEAIYIAQARPFKRMQLAKDIKFLYILTYGCRDYTNAAGENDLAKFQPDIAHANWNKKFIHNRRDVSSIICQSHAGLALSKREGAMWASVQYMLCGIPVVTTPSRGGREYFFDNRHTYRVKPNSTSVKEAVEMAELDSIDPNEIRSAVLSKITSERLRYVRFLKHEFGFRQRSDDLDIHDYIWGSDVGIKSFLFESDN
jgi:glycosyltransferase involved in cell wall biosynthesis